MREPEDALPRDDLPSLEECSVGGRPLRVRLAGQSRFGAQRFYLFPDDAPGAPAPADRDASQHGAPHDAAPHAASPHDGGHALITGLRQRRSPASHNWVDLDRFALDPLSADGQALLRCFLRLVPPGGHVMVEYDGPQHRETVRRLMRNWPPVATPLGWALFQAGAGAVFKDWYYSEGGNEGPRKLQAFRPCHPDHDRDAARRALAALDAFHDRAPADVRDTLASIRAAVAARA